MILKAPICRMLHPDYAMDRNLFTGCISASGYRLGIIEPSKSKGTRFQEGYRGPGASAYGVAPVFGGAQGSAEPVPCGTGTRFREVILWPDCRRLWGRNGLHGQTCCSRRRVP